MVAAKAEKLTGGAHRRDFNLIDPEVIDRLWTQCAGRLTLYARSLGGEAEDAVQEAFVKLTTQPCVPDNPMAWLVRVIRNNIHGQRRRQAVAERHAESLARSTKWFDACEAGRCIEAGELQHALSTLPEELRECVVLRLWGGFSFEEIARLTATSSSTAHRRYREALQSLKDQIEGDS